MNKAEAVDVLAQNTGVSKADVDRVLSAFFELAGSQANKGDKLVIPGWLTVERVQRSARQGRNPQTGETIQIPAKMAVKLTAGSKLKSAVQ